MVEQPRVIPEPSTPIESDELSTLESQGFENDNLEQRAKIGDHRRREGTLDNITSAAIYALRLAVALVGIFAVTWGWHIVMPDKWRWLDRDQVATLQSIIVSGVASSALTAYIRRYLSK